MEANGEAIKYRDRASGRVETEVVFKDWALRFLYEDRAGRMLTDWLLTGAPVSRFYGWLQRTSRSRGAIDNFVRTLGIDASLADRPVADYTSLDDFFTRRLKPGARPIDSDPDALVSPADARTFVVPRLEGRRLRVKESEVPVGDLLGDEALATRYAGGVAFVFRLAPADYHRFHFPEGGLAGPARELGGALHSVHPIALAAGAPAFKNKRTVTVLNTERFGALALIEVGAMLVGSIVQTYRPGSVARGAEKGYFCFGGSTIVMLVEPGKLDVAPDLLEWSALPSSPRATPAIETWLPVGAAVGRRPARAPGG